MKIMLDKERDFNLTIRGVIEYEKLGYGKVIEITDKSSSRLIELARQMGDDGFKEFVALREDKGKLPEDKMNEKIMKFLSKYKIDMNAIRDEIPYENAIVLFRLGLGLKTDDEVYDILEKASNNEDSTVTTDNFDNIVYKLLLDSKADELEKNAEKTVPLP